MKRLAAIILLCFIANSAVEAKAPVHVKGYSKRNGTYVMPSVRSSPNGSRHDNYGSKPNVNPLTGKTGSKNPWAPPKPRI